MTQNFNSMASFLTEMMLWAKNNTPAKFNEVVSQQDSDIYRLSEIKTLFNNLSSDEKDRFHAMRTLEINRKHSEALGILDVSGSIGPSTGTIRYIESSLELLEKSKIEYIGTINDKGTVLDFKGLPKAEQDVSNTVLPTEKTQEDTKPIVTVFKANIDTSQPVDVSTFPPRNEGGTSMMQALNEALEKTNVLYNVTRIKQTIFTDETKNDDKNENKPK